MRAAQRWELGLLTFDAVLLAVLEMFFLPLRFDGTVLPELGDFPLPVAILVAWLSMSLLTRRAASVVSRPVYSALPLIAWLATVGVLILAGPGGDMLLLPDWRMLLLVGGTVLTTMLVPGRLAPQVDTPAGRAGGRRG